MLPAYDEGVYYPAWSPDGRVIAYTSDREGGSRLFLHPLEGGPIRALTPPELRVMEARWTQDGRSLFVSTMEEELYRVPSSGGEPRFLAGGLRGFASCRDRLFLSRRGEPGCSDCPRLAESTPAGERVILRLPSRARINDVRCDHAGEKLVYSLSSPTGGPAIGSADL